LIFAFINFGDSLKPAWNKGLVDLPCNILILQGFLNALLADHLGSLGGSFPKIKFFTCFFSDFETFSQPTRFSRIRSFK